MPTPSNSCGRRAIRSSGGFSSKKPQIVNAIVRSWTTGAREYIEAANNLIVDYDPGVANLAGTAPEDFDLVAGSEAIDQGADVPSHDYDFLNRPVPAGGGTDIGAFEFGGK